MNNGYADCPACGAPRPERTADLPEARYAFVFVCPACDAVYGRCYLGESYAIVGNRWHPGPPPARERYFDFETLGGRGFDRRHGWYDPETRLITQTG